MELLTEATSHRGLMYATFPDLTLSVPILQAIGAGSSRVRKETISWFTAD